LADGIHQTVILGTGQGPYKYAFSPAEHAALLGFIAIRCLTLERSKCLSRVVELPRQPKPRSTMEVVGAQSRRCFTSVRD
jgi:hypothetical protein